MPIETGLWDINGNGFEGRLNIETVDNQGRLRGSVFEERIQGFFDDDAQRITFLREIAGGASAIQIYTGYRFQQGTIDSRPVLTGYFEAFEGTGGQAKRNVFGWFAFKIV